jgi:hypothetical protein
VGKSARDIYTFSTNLGKGREFFSVEISSQPGYKQYQVNSKWHIHYAWYSLTPDYYIYQTVVTCIVFS